MEKEEKDFLDNLEEKQANERPLADSEEEVWRVIEESDDITKEEFIFLEKNQDVVKDIAAKEYEDLLDKYDTGKISEKKLNEDLIDIIKRNIFLRKTEKEAVSSETGADLEKEKQIIAALKKKIEDYIKDEENLINKLAAQKTEESERRKRNAESRKRVLEFLLGRENWTLDNFINGIEKNREPHHKTGFIVISDKRFNELMSIARGEEKPVVSAERADAAEKEKIKEEFEEMTTGWSEDEKEMFKEGFLKAAEVWFSGLAELKNIYTKKMSFSEKLAADMAKEESGKALNEFYAQADLPENKKQEIISRTIVRFLE